MASARLFLALALLLTGCGSTSPPSTSATFSRTEGQAIDVRRSASPLVRVDSDLTPAALVGGEMVLELRVSNVGRRDIRDLTIILNDAYMSKMTVLETRPRAIRHNEQGGEYFIFRTLPKGATQRYIIRMSPNDTGDFFVDVDIAEWSPPIMAPLPDADGGVAEYVYETQALTR